MATLRQLHIVLTNETEGHRFSEFHEPVEPEWTHSEIYRMMQREYGRCTSKIYIDKRIPTNDHGGERWEVQQVGWFFISRQRYEDTGEPYLRGAWVTLQTVVTQEEVIAA